MVLWDASEDCWRSVEGEEAEGEGRVWRGTMRAPQSALLGGESVTSLDSAAPLDAEFDFFTNASRRVDTK